MSENNDVINQIDPFEIECIYKTAQNETEQMNLLRAIQLLEEILELEKNNPNEPKL